MRLINVGLGNQGEVLKLWVLNKKEKNPLKETIEVRANLIPLLEFVFSKLKNKDWKEIVKRKHKWNYPRLENDEFKNLLNQNAQTTQTSRKSS